MLGQGTRAKGPGVLLWGVAASPALLTSPPPHLQLETLCGGAYAPVCGKDGVTYASVCHLQLSCADYGHAGECGGAGLGVSLPNFEFTPRLGMLYLCLAVLAFVTLILDHLAVPR